MQQYRNQIVACVTLLMVSASSNLWAIELKPYQIAIAQPLVLAKHAIVGQWTCEYAQHYAGGAVMKAVSVDDYGADGQNVSKTTMTIELPQKTIHYQMQSSSTWQLLPGDVLDHQHWRLIQFEVDDPEVEKLLKVRENLQKKTQFKTQIIQVDAHNAVVRGINPDGKVNQESTCYR